MLHEAPVVKVVGKSGQISLGKRWAGKALRMEARDDGAILLTPVALIPEGQVWTLSEPHRSKIARALSWAARTPARQTDLDALVSSAARRRKPRASR